MITVDELEVLLRTIPQYFLFGATSLYIFAWIDQKQNLSIIAEILLIVIGLISFIVMLSGMIPSPMTEGLVQEHVELVIRMLTLLMINGFLAAGSLVYRLIKKKGLKLLAVVIFILSVYIFFSSTRISKIKFELNVPQTEELSS